jgi:hypothetical protein
MALEARRTPEIGDQPQTGPVRTPVEPAQAGAAARATTDMAQQLMQQGQDFISWGLRTFSDVNEPASEAGFEHVRRTTDMAAQMSSVYRDAVERSADGMQALVASVAQLYRGLPQWQHAWCDLTQHWIARVAERRGELLQPKSPIAFVEAQRDIYLDFVGSMFAANTSLLQLAGKVAEGAVRPLQDRARSAPRT